MKVSVVIPIYNERDNIALMYGELTDALATAPFDYELLFVDDGSTDGGTRKIEQLTHEDASVRLVRFRRNYGQTAAMQAGIERAKGDVIATIDGDLQNDPRDIVPMVEKLHEGYDLVHGWRKQRHDAWLSRKLPSKVANWIISTATNVPVNDLGCTLKVMRTEIAQDLKLYGEMHRFIPILAAQKGARCAEVVTNHRSRQFGDSKYGISRTIQVLLDLVTVKYLQNYFANPMKLFGKLALGCGLLSGMAMTATVSMKMLGGVDMTGNPLLMLAVFFMLACLQLFGLGLLGEVSARIYFDAQQNRPYSIASDSVEDESPATRTKQRQYAA